jgi:peptidoglycan/xylan/chitin deacetylase (PgdA/CDA1 family)
MDDRHAWVGHIARRVGGALVASLLIPKDSVRVVMTHHVFQKDMENFRFVIESLRSQRVPITPEDFFRHFADHATEPLNGQALLFTFDDGLLSAYECAQQVLNPMGIKAIFFIPTKILELTTEEEMREFAWGQLYYGMRLRGSVQPEEYVTMNTHHLRRLHEQGHMILPHTHSHLLLREITTPDLVESELIRPKAIIEDLLQSRASGFASPVGTPRTVNAYAYRQISTIYDLCFTALSGANTHSTDRMLIRRDSIHPWYSVQHATNIVDGIFDPYFWLEAKKLRRKVRWKHLAAARGSVASQEVVLAPKRAE